MFPRAEHTLARNRRVHFVAVSLIHILIERLSMTFTANGNKETFAVFGKFKERLKGEKRVMEHHQTVARPHNGTPGC